MNLIVLASLLWQAHGLAVPLASDYSITTVGHSSQALAMHRIGTVLQPPDEQLSASKKIESVIPRSLETHTDLLREPLERDPNKPYPYVLRILLRKAIPLNQSANGYALEFAETKHIELDLENVFRMDKSSVFMMVQITPNMLIELRKDPRVDAVLEPMGAEII